MKKSTYSRLFLSGPEKPMFMEKGLYSGYKNRNGLGCELPATLESGEEYTSTGFLDALPHEFIKQIAVRKVQLDIECSGQALLSFYILLENEKIYHCKDCNLTEGKNSVNLPTILLDEPNSRLIFFKIKAIDSIITIFNWAYIALDPPEYLQKCKELTVLSRTLGDSTQLINQFIDLNDQYERSKDDYPGTEFLPFPNLIIYESDRKSYLKSRLFIQDKKINFITLKHNKANLGGGGNMCLTVYEECITRATRNQFIMLDSDTLIPFRTLYFSVALAGLHAYKQTSISIVPTILYSKNPDTILESGALFGRGNWGIAASNASQPCIAPLHNGQKISDKKTQAAIIKTRHTDYPPFIYSIFSMKNKEDKIQFLPVPFFLRGDDIELGINLRHHNIECEANGFLVVFQEPKHSLWHEFMAILHGTCLIFASHNSENNDQELNGLRDYFLTRTNCHSSAFDISGLHTYNSVLERIISLLEWNDEDAAKKFHDPDYYLKMRSLNSRFSQANYRVIQALEENGGIDSNRIVRVPFLYYETQMRACLEKTAGLPDQIILINDSNKTANIIDMSKIDASQIQQARSEIIEKLDIIVANARMVSKKCKLICDRNHIISEYLAQYSLKAKTARKQSSIKSIA